MRRDATSTSSAGFHYERSVTDRQAIVVNDNSQPKQTEPPSRVAPADSTSRCLGSCRGGLHALHFGLYFRFSRSCVTPQLGFFQLSLNPGVKSVDLFLKLRFLICPALGMLCLHLSKVSFHGGDVLVVNLVRNISHGASEHASPNCFHAGVYRSDPFFIDFGDQGHLVWLQRLCDIIEEVGAKRCI